MAELTYREKIIVAAVEAAYGSDETPGAANAIRTRNLQPTYYGGPTIQEEVDRVSVGGYSDINPAPMSAMQFEVYAVSHGNVVPETVPGWAPVVRMCGLGETINAGTSIVYQPEAPADMDSVSAYFHRSSHRQRQLGSRGNLTMDFSTGQFAFFGINSQGLYQRPTNTPIVVPSSFGELASARPVNNTTTRCVFNGVNVLMRSLTLDMGNEVVHENLPGQDSVFITDRDVSGQLQITAEDIVDHDWFADMESHQNGAQTFALQLIHSDDGTAGTPGQALQLDAAQVQLGVIEESETNGKVVYTLPLKFLPSGAGNDEFTLTLT